MACTYLVAVSISSTFVYFKYTKQWNRSIKNLDRMLLMYPCLLAIPFVILLFVGEQMSRGWYFALYVIGSVFFITFVQMPRNAVMSLACNMVHPNFLIQAEVWVTLARLLGRAIGPPIGSYSPAELYPMLMVGFLLANALLVGFFWKRLVPLNLALEHQKHVDLAKTKSNSVAQQLGNPAIGLNKSIVAPVRAKS